MVHMEEGKAPTKNTYIHNPKFRNCAIVGCKVEAELVNIASTYHGLRVEVFVCQRHIGGKNSGS